MGWLNFKWCAAIVIFLSVFSSIAYSGSGSRTETNRIQNLRTGKQQAGAFTGDPDILYTKAPWQLNVYLTHKGSRSQGSHGVLLKNGKPVHGKKGDSLDTAIGIVRYEGPYGTQAHLWSSSGWVMVEQKVKPTETEDHPPQRDAPDMIKLEEEIRQIQPDKQ